MIGAFAGAVDAARASIARFRARPNRPETPRSPRWRLPVPTRSRSIQPRWTWILDLTPDEAALRRGLSAGHRGAINAARRRGLTVPCRAAIPATSRCFFVSRRTTAAAGRFRGQAQSYHRAVARTLMPEHAAALYIAEAAGEAVAAALCFDFAGTRYYAHAVSDPDAGRRLQAAAPLVWQMILDARARRALIASTSGESRPPRTCSGSGAAPVGRVLAVQAIVRR